jgi:thiamine biosynthesis lipoprotein
MNEFKITTKRMGSVFELIVGSSNAEQANHILHSGLEEIERIEGLLSEFREGSSTYIINKNAGIRPVSVNDEVFALLIRCQRISMLTQGAFDISVGPLKRTYQFKNKEFQLPAKKKLQEARHLVGFQKIQLDKTVKEVFLPIRGMHISFAAIGKGYAADCVKKSWLEKGVTSGVINASGDLTTIGKRPNGVPWNVGIAHPDNKDTFIISLPVMDSSVATSSDHEQHFIHNGIRYSHNINPITGVPVAGIKSVSIISKSAELCDALATAVYVMGKEVGMHLLNQFPQVHGMIIDSENKTYYSNKIDFQYEA